MTDPESTMRVAYQGAEGSYSRLAAGRHFEHFRATGPAARFVGHATFRMVARAVEAGEADYGVLPIENTTAGSINEVYDLLARGPLWIVGEEFHEIDHCLVTLAPVPLESLQRVFSQAEAIAQCTDFLATLEGCQAVAYTDTAMSCARVKADGDPAQAAIASAEAAALHGLHVLRSGIANQRLNFTRFVIVARSPEPVAAGVPSKTSLVFAARHEEGALLRCLHALADQHLNLTKLESRPRPGTPWEYLFYVDFDGNVEEPRVTAALGALGERTSLLKLLGTYPSRPAPGGGGSG